MKRPLANVLTKNSKRQRTNDPEIEETTPIHEQAAPYLLAIAKFPIDALSAEWSFGVNRSIDTAHQRRLCEIFNETGILRRDPSHQLQIACSKEHVEQMLHHLKVELPAQSTVTSATFADKEGLEWPSFKSWKSVTGGTAELITGHHRVEAFKEYLRLRQLGEEERWWVCRIYDKDTLPPDTRVKLRANRADITLPDNHGQIWSELTSLFCTNANLFQGSSKSVEKEMREHLQLSSRVKFPIRRLVTLWRNQNWQPLLTRWCSTAIGQATFNLSTFEWMASCRIDDHWFAAFENVLRISTSIRKQYGVDASLADWNTLASLPQARSPHDVQDLFYPGEELDKDPGPSHTRRQGFFPTLSNEAYHALYSTVLSKPTHTYTNILALLKTPKKEGKLMRSIMTHVSQWVNSGSAKVSDSDNNKPALRKYLVPVLQSRHAGQADQKSLDLQQEVLQHVQQNAEAFTSSILDRYIDEYPSAEIKNYGARFQHKVWRELLSIVTSFTGPTLHNKHLACLIQSDTYIARTPTIAQIACDAICQVPEVVNEPALQSTRAANDLLETIQVAITEWMSRHTLEDSDNTSQEVPLPARHSNAESSRERELNLTVSEAARSVSARSSSDQLTPELISHPSTEPRIPKASQQTKVQNRGIEDLSLSDLAAAREKHRQKRTLSDQVAVKGSASLSEKTRKKHRKKHTLGDQVAVEGSASPSEKTRQKQRGAWRK